MNDLFAGRFDVWVRRDFSWSQMSCFEWDKEDWYQSYWLGVRSKPSKEILFGSKIDRMIQEDDSFIPSLRRYPIMQHKMRTVFNDIPLIGIADGVDLSMSAPACGDFKTGKVAWDQKRADATGQLTFYSFLLYKCEKIRPEELDLFIHWLPTKEGGDFQICFRDDPVVPIDFQTKRTMVDVLKFGTQIEKIREAMLSYAKAHA